MSGRVLNKLPERENLKRNIRRERSKNTPPNPRNLTELLEIPELYRRTFTGDNFLMYDSRAYDSTVRDFCHMLAALAYVPVCDVKAAFAALKTVAPELPQIPELIAYFGAAYVIGVPGAGRRHIYSTLNYINQL